jgi:hypothetical protein
MTTDKVALALLQGFLSALNQHCSQRGSAASATIGSADTFASYFNGDGNFYDVLYSPDFLALYTAITGVALVPANCFSPEIKQSGQGLAMGKWDYNGGSPAFTDGAAVDAKYLGAKPKLKVTTKITKAGESNIVITVTGVDHTGEAAKTWTHTATADIDTGNYDFAEVNTRWLRNVAATAGIAVTGAGAGVCYVEGWEPR